MNYINSNICSRVLLLKINDSTATCFSIEHNNVQYLITARHVFEDFGFPCKLRIQIFNENRWKTLDVNIYYHSNNNIDIAVLHSEIQNITYKLPVECDCKFILSQEMYFLGFPYGLSISNFDYNAGYPLPFVKKAIMSGTIYNGETAIHVLDGINNPGFSGGPVIYYSIDQTPHICGVISGYRYDRSHVLMDDNPTQLYVKENTGLILFYDINKAIEIIENASII